jgi:pimeloyl-ACP methyl ester carboxylesterase
MPMRLVFRTLRCFFFGTILLVAGIGFYAYTPDIPVETLKAKYAGPPSQFMELEGLNVHYRDEGRRDDSMPLVLIHGTGSSLFTWDAWVRRLSADFRLIRLDLPNYALTGSDGRNLYMGPDYAVFIAKFLDRLKVRQCYMAGNSLGGEVCWQFARLYPEGIRKMILIDAAGIPTPPKSRPLGFRIARMPVLRDVVKYLTPRAIFESSVRNVYADPLKVTPALIDQYADMTLRAGNRAAIIRRFKADHRTYAENRHEDLPGIQTPTLILWGAQDGLIPVEAAYKFQTALPNDTLVIFPNAGHVPMEELGEESAAVARYFLLNFKNK